MQVSEQRNDNDRVRRRRIVGRDVLPDKLENAKGKFLSSPISTLGLEKRAENALKRVGIETIDDLVGHKESSIRELNGFGQKAMFTVKWALVENNLSFRTPTSESPQEKEKPVPDGKLEKGKQGLDAGEGFVGLHESIIKLGLSVRAINCLNGAGIMKVEDLVHESEFSLSRIRGIGRRVLRETKDAVDKAGLRLEERTASEDALFLGVRRLGLSMDTERHLETAGIIRVEHLVEKTEQELLQSPHITRVHLRSVKHALSGFGLSLREEEKGQEHQVPEFRPETENAAFWRADAGDAPEEEFAVDRYSRMSRDELLDTARTFIQNENIGDMESFRKNAPVLSGALEKSHGDGIFRELGLEKRQRNWAAMVDGELVGFAKEFIAENGIGGRSELAKVDSGLYATLLKRKLLDEVGLLRMRRETRQWSGMDDGELIGFARAYVKKRGIKRRSELAKVDSGLYATLLKRKLLDETGLGDSNTKHRDWALMGNEELVEYTKDFIAENKIGGRSELQKKDAGLYMVLKRRKLLDEAGLKDLRGRPRGWVAMDDEGLVKFTNKFIVENKIGSRSELQRADAGLYHALWRRKLLNEVGFEETANHERGSGPEKTSNSASLTELVALGKEAKKEIGRLLETVKPENLKATMRLLENL